MIYAMPVTVNGEQYAIVVERDAVAIAGHLTPDSGWDQGLDPLVAADIQRDAQNGDCYLVTAFNSKGSVVDSLGDMTGHTSARKAAEVFVYEYLGRG